MSTDAHPQMPNLRRAIDYLPESVLLTLSVGQIRSILQRSTPEPDAHLTATEVGAHPEIRRSAATIRRWQNAAHFQGAYQDRNGEWRFPPQAIPEILVYARSGGPSSRRKPAVNRMTRADTPTPTPPPANSGRGDSTDLSGWKRIRNG